MERTAVVAITEGLHARPAALFAQKAGEQPTPVKIAKTAGGDPVDAASVLGILTLGASAGDEVVLRTDDDGDDATTSLDALVEFLSQETVA
jgi:phosphocarrier protein HPr